MDWGDEIGFLKKIKEPFNNLVPAYLSQCGVLQPTENVLGPLSVARRLAQQENGQRGSFGPLGDVDQLLQTRHTQRYVLGGHTGVVESVECHLCGRLSQRLSSQGADHFTRMGLGNEENERLVKLK